jgi:hypothetical protein
MTFLDAIPVVAQYPIWVKVFIAFWVFCTFVLVVILIFTAPGKPTAKSSSSDTITSHNQSGGITAHTVNKK